MRRQIQIVMQDPYSTLDPRMTVRELVAEPFAIHRDAVPPQGRDRAVRDLLGAVGLSREHLDRYPHEFSGGQLQRIGIARALALRPRVLVCDEPVSALDVSVQAQVINLLKDLQAEFGLSYIFISHDLSVVRHMSDRVAVMYLGKVVEIGDEEEIYDRAAHPYTQALHSAAAGAGRDGWKRIVLAGVVRSAMHPPPGCSFHTRCWKAQPVCAVDEPALTQRPGSAHPCACHFADTSTETATAAAELGTS